MDNTIYIMNEEGREVEMKILLTFDAEDRNYVVIHPKDNDEELFAFIYDDEGNLTAVEDEEELDMVNEVIAAFDEGDDAQ